MLALVLIRGLTGTKTEIRATLDTLRIRKKHVCVVVEDNPSYRASALKCKDYITFGEINEETYKQLVEKRGEKQPDGKLKKFFCLHPPRGGFERKGIKKPFIKGGALGYRGDKINALIKKML
ncbi:uL30 family ribosomal protein [Candidatus Woesearchaeota archaeon]|nr:uL30 family ribosomal protein [Candidatus Woesearchaeota archaeon]